MDYLENRLNVDVVDLIYEKLHKTKFKDTLKQIKTIKDEIELDVPEMFKGIFKKMTLKKGKPTHSIGKYDIDWYKEFSNMKMIEPKIKIDYNYPLFL